MRKLIFDILDLTRIESGQKARVLRKINASEAVKQVFETFEAEAKLRGIGLHIQATDPQEMTGEPGELEIMLNNLVSNAIKYNKDNGMVTVVISGNAEAITIAVTDTGIGMDDEEMDRLFGEFVRIKNDKTRSISGSGLGLSILRRLARLNGGDVSVISRPNIGSTFTLTMNRCGTPSNPQTSFQEMEQR